MSRCSRTNQALMASSINTCDTMMDRPSSAYSSDHTRVSHEITRPNLEVNPPSDDSSTAQSRDEVASLHKVDSRNPSPLQPEVLRRESQVRFSVEVPESPRIRPIEHTSTFASQFSNTSLDEKWAPQQVLCLDGGGVRGYSTLLMLKRLMKHVIEIEKTHTHPASSSFDTHDTASYPSIAQHIWGTEEEKMKHNDVFLPCHYFDYMFGTSTGGLIAILLGRLRMSIEEALETYENLAGTIFGRPRTMSMRGPIPWCRSKHSSKRYENILKKLIDSKQCRESVQQEVRGGVFSRDPTFNSEPLMCRTVCVAYCDEGVSVGNPTLFRSYEHIATGKLWERNPGPAHAIPIWKIARATSAAPTYFDGMEIDGTKFVDGAVGSNNPALEAYNEVRSMHNSNDECIGLFLSFGTGESTHLPAPTGTFRRAKYLAKALFNHALGTRQANEQLEQVSDLRFPYHRFSVRNDLKATVKLDDWKQAAGDDLSTKDTITQLTNDYLDNGMTKEEVPVRVEDRLREVAEKLVESRRQRASTLRWHMAMGLRYRCTVDRCRNGQKIRNTRNDLVNHMNNMHHDIDEDIKLKHIKKGTLLR